MTLQADLVDIRNECTGPPVKPAVDVIQSIDIHKVTTVTIYIYSILPSSQRRASMMIVKTYYGFGFLVCFKSRCALR